MQICKLHQVGHSIVLTIPAAYRRKLGWRIGMYVSLLVTAKNNLFVRSLESVTPTHRSTNTKGPGELTKLASRARLPRD